MKAITEDWLEEYNTIRPHDALDGLQSMYMLYPSLDFLLLTGTKNLMLTIALYLA